MMAGLYETNRHEHVTTFAILTTESTGALREIHEREPLVLSAEAGRQWLRRDQGVDEVARLARHTLSSEGFAWHAISIRVNNAKNDGPDLVAPSKVQ